MIESLLSKCESPSSNPSIDQKKKKKKRKEKKKGFPYFILKIEAVKIEGIMSLSLLKQMIWA
jgi:hypothetical protein